MREEKGKQNKTCWVGSTLVFELLRNALTFPLPLKDTLSEHVQDPKEHCVNPILNPHRRLVFLFFKRNKLRGIVKRAPRPEALSNFVLWKQDATPGHQVSIKDKVLGHSQQ